MTERKSIVVAKPLDLNTAVMRSEGLLRIWNIDLETAPEEEIRALCVAGAEALRDGALGGVAAAITTAATRLEIVRQIDELVSAFAGMRKDVDLGVSSKIMAEEIAALSPSAVALHAALRGLIRTNTFPPSIAEVISAVVAQKAEWCARAGLLERLPKRILEAAKTLPSKDGT